MSFRAARWSGLALGLGLALALSSAGCGGPSADESLGRAASASTFANDKTAFDYFLGKGLTTYQAAGIVGNLDQESGVDPTAVESGGPGRGIAQWSVGGRWDTDANDNATWYAGTQGQSVESLQLQLDFIWYELTTFSSYGLAALQKSTSVTDATVDFETDFEGCSMCDQSTRIGYAENVLGAYGSDTVDAGGGPPTDAGGPMTDTGTPETDGGAPIHTDAGATPDASAIDAATHDAAAPDAAPAAGDAASSAPGKGCSTAPGSLTGSGAACSLVALAGLATRRRRARHRVPT
jgi:Phage tail lysozyme